MKFQRLESRKRKANMLSLQKQTAVVQMKKKYPEYSARLIAEELNVTINQVYNTLRKHKEGKIGKPKAKEAQQKRAAFEKARAELDKQTDFSFLKNTLESILKDVIATIQTDQELTAKEQVDLTDRVAKTLKVLMDSNVASNVRNPDALLTVQMMRQIDPDLSDEQIIEHFHMAVRQLKGTTRR